MGVFFVLKILDSVLGGFPKTFFKFFFLKEIA